MRCSDSLRGGRLGVRKPVEVRFSAHIQTVLGDDATSPMGTEPFPDVKRPGLAANHLRPSTA